MTATLRMKHSFSRQHLAAARHFARLATKVEEQTEANEILKAEHRAYVTGTVVFSVAFLEASINELHLEALDGNRKSLLGLTDQQLAKLKTSKKGGKKILSKYQRVLSVCGIPRFKEESELFQSVNSLIKIRNALIHYHPEWDDELKVHKNIQNKVSGKFALNRFTGKSSLWFPHQCLGAGCARWGVERVEQFMAEFCRRIGIPSRLP